MTTRKETMMTYVKETSEVVEKNIDAAPQLVQSLKEIGGKSILFLRGWKKLRHRKQLTM